MNFYDLFIHFNARHESSGTNPGPALEDPRGTRAGLESRSGIHRPHWHPADIWEHKLSLPSSENSCWLQLTCALTEKKLK